MSINFADYPVHLREGMKFEREYVQLQLQKDRDAGSKAFQGDALELSQMSKNRDAVMDKMKHTVVQSAASFSDTRAGIMKEIREEKGQYDYSDVVNACGLSYAKICSEIERRHENVPEQYYKADGTLLTKEEETEWLDVQFEQEVEWQKSCARIAARGQVFQGRIPEMPTKEIEELEDSLYRARDAYMKLYRENKQDGNPLTLQNEMFGSSRMYEMLNRLGNLRESQL